MFIDRVVVHVIAGAGGAGASSFRRESFVPKGGPDGGKGGSGGSVYVRADPNLGTLLDYQYRAHWKAERGQHGKGKNMTGKSGIDLYLPVPPGTVVTNVASGEVLGEMLAAGDTLLVAKGGRGGRGNASFATPTHQSPREWEPGQYGDELDLELVLKLIADVGLLGEPNAGKSTLLSVVSAARPKVADYPFTTLQPNLGVVGLSDHRSFVMADIPGIIEGAHEGKGLGLRFLQHVERTRVIAVLVPLDSPDPQATYDLLMREATLYNGELGAKPHVVVLTKLDLLPPGDPLPALQPQGDAPVCAISAVTRAGLPELLETLWQTLRAGTATTSRPILALAQIPGIGAARLRTLIAAFESAGAVLQAPHGAIAALPGLSRAAATAIRGVTLRSGYDILDTLDRLGATVLLPGDDAFPRLLAEIPDSPSYLYAWGNLTLLARPAAGIVGSRNHSPYGAAAARLLATGVARSAVVVSGMARGLDAIAHAAALDAGGGTVGVLGNGFGVVYPAANRELYDRMIAHGCLITELPPGERPHAGAFPRRNRLISGLAAVTVVVEAAPGSGALITADCALDQGRAVLAVPGPITSPTSLGCNKLIQQGAKPALCAEDILEELGLGSPAVSGQAVAGSAVRAAPAGLTGLEQALWQALQQQARHVDVLVAAVGSGAAVATAEVLTALTELELRGVVRQTPGMVFALA